MRRILVPLLLLSASAFLTGCYTTVAPAGYVGYTPSCSYVTTVKCNTCNTCRTGCNRCMTGCCGSPCGYGCGYGYTMFDNGWY